MSSTSCKKRRKKGDIHWTVRTGNESSFVVVDVLWRGGGGGASFFTARYGLRICEPRLVLCGKALLSHG